ncbi:MAG: 1-deoxy-D-xylulose-5-phosphate reductoisomerase [Desulfobacterales bacterium]|nr:MAG: 1-deoxy-D-xylulose-5-phosphate reductoisomerase [Desulfobacterales bacterium]
MKYLSVMGATGSIGANVLSVVRQFPEKFAVTALAAHTSVDRLAGQIREFSPSLAVVRGPEEADALAALLADTPAPRRVEILHGPDGYRTAAALSGTDIMVGAMMGAAGLHPTLAAIEAGIPVALANKETLVMAGPLVMARAAEKNVPILPVDSEHSAVFQSIQGERRKDLSGIFLTASGGPFRELPVSEFAAITPERALKHPNWSMGRKISIDSATLMNKGLEVIEARWLFDLCPEEIEVVVHPQSIIHSMAKFRDGSVIAQLGIPDMRGAIAYALSYPGRLPLDLPAPDFTALGRLDFEPPDRERFPCLGLAFEALAAGGVMPAVLNAANEVAVDAFLHRRIPFTGIADLVREALDLFAGNEFSSTGENPDLETLIAADARSRQLTAARTEH